RERGVTVLLVEQNANMALHIADYGYVLEVGRIVMEDTCARLIEKEDIKEFYLGMKESGVRGTRRWKRKKTWRWPPGSRPPSSARTLCRSSFVTSCASGATAPPCARRTWASGAPSAGASTASGPSTSGSAWSRSACATATWSRSWPTTARSGSTPT